MKKYFLFLACATTLLCASVGLAACKKGGDDDSAGNLTGGLELKQTLMSLDRYESGTLVATVDGSSNSAIVWSSSNPSVASVTDGRVVACGEGTTDITATYGTQTATCSVTVEDSGIVPTLSLGNADVAMLKDGEYSIDARVVYKNEITTDATFTYTVEDSAYATVSNDSGLIQSVALGETQVSIQASWRGYTKLYGVVTVKVLPNIDVALSGYESEIFTYGGTVEGHTFVNSTTCVATVYSEDVLVENPDLTWYSSNENVLTVNDEGLVSAKNQGVATVWYTYEEGGREYSSERVDVTVSVATVDHTVMENAEDRFISLSDLSNGEVALSSSEIFSDGNIVGVYDVDDTATNLYSNGKLKVSGRLGQQKYLFMNEAKYAYVMNLTFVTDVITSVDEFFAIDDTDRITHTARMDADGSGWLNEINTETDTEGEYYYGYYVLGQDIDFGNIVVNKTTGYDTIGSKGGTLGDERSYRFMGVLDGRGYALKNVHIVDQQGTSKGALLIQAAAGAIIRNLKADITIDRVTDADTASYCGFIGWGYESLIQNCQITLTTQCLAEKPNAMVGAIFSQINQVQIENTVVVENISAVVSTGKNLSLTGVQNKGAKLYHVYVIKNVVNGVTTSVGTNGGFGNEINSASQNSDVRFVGATETKDMAKVLVDVNDDNGFDMKLWKVEDKTLKFGDETIANA